MDHCHIVNYSFDQEFHNKYDSGKNQTLHSSESGYESMLATSANSTSFFSSQYASNNDSNDSSVFSLPTTPAKRAPSTARSATKVIYSGSNCSRTPDFKQQYVADVNSYYFKSIRSSYDSSSSSDHYPSSQSQSPKQSFYNANADSYVSTRDTINTKLLRSPAFKIDTGFSPHQPQYQPIERPSIKSFSSRFVAEMPKFEQLPSPAKPTPTEAEFMQMLISNHHMPDNPEFLIGRNMGVDNVNILGELNKRSMSNVIDQIFSYLGVGDIVKVGCVSKEWRNMVKSNSALNRERVRFIKARRHIYETTKENHTQIMGSNKRRLSSMGLSEKRDMYKSTKSCVNIENNIGSGIFTSLDVNRLNNLQEPVSQRKRLLEQQFRDFSITDESIFSMSPTKQRSPSKRASPVKRSPLKRHSPIKKSSVATPLICSKKSKRNLKRL